ncbi:hypothetical protein SALBM311S_07009 [Streptomyces alboniger]
MKARRTSSGTNGSSRTWEASSCWSAGAGPAAAGGGHPASGPGFLGGAAQPLRRVDGRAAPEGDPAVAVEAGRRRVACGLQPDVGEDAGSEPSCSAVTAGRGSRAFASSPVWAGLALASHTVASPQIRNRGGVGGNLGTASPAGDAHPALLAAGAEVEVESVRGSRLIPIDAFYTGVKRNALAADELIRAVHVRKADGPQQFSKVGTRNAMVIAVCAFGIALHPSSRTVRTGIGSAAPTPVRAKAAEEFLNAALEEGGFWDNGKIITPSVAKQFADLCAGACNPIDDVRGTASYRRHAVGIMARRTLTWTWESYRGTATTEGVA